MDLYWTLVFLHVVAFAYWLGASVSSNRSEFLEAV